MHWYLLALVNSHLTFSAMDVDSCVFDCSRKKSELPDAHLCHYMDVFFCFRFRTDTLYLSKSWDQDWMVSSCHICLGRHVKANRAGGDSQRL